MTENVKTSEQPAAGQEEPKDAKQMALKDIKALETEIAKARAEYDALLADKRAELEALKGKIQAVNSAPDELLGKRPIASIYAPEQLMNYPPEEMAKVISAHLEKQLEGTTQDIWPAVAWERKKQQYTEEMVKYLLALKRGLNANAGGNAAHPAGIPGRQVKDLAKILDITPIVEIAFT